MAAQRHSSTVDGLLDVASRIESATWPPHPTTGRVPRVGKENETIDTPDEFVDIVARVEDSTASVEWARIGVGAVGRRDERYWIDVIIVSSVPGKSRVAALERIRDLAEVAEGLFYDASTGAHLPVGGDAPWATDLGGIRQVVPDARREDEGWTAACVVSVAVAARI